MKTRDIRRITRSLGWFGIALGVTELVASKRLARAYGVRRGLLRIFGLREIGSGIGLLMRRRSGGLFGMRRKRPNLALAIAAVAPVVALDVFASQLRD